MRANESHESYTRDEQVERPPDRQFGFVFTVVCAVLAVWPALWGRPVRWWSAGLAAAFLIFALVAPRVLAPLNRLWLRIGQVLHVCSSWVFLALIFFTTVTPIGLLLRMLGKDPLRRRFDARASTYWIERRPPGPAGDTMPNQF
jgi:hypothetical protein